jgi:hypothetical protein
MNGKYQEENQDKPESEQLYPGSTVNPRTYQCHFGADSAAQYVWDLL